MNDSQQEKCNGGPEISEACLVPLELLELGNAALANFVKGRLAELASAGETAELVVGDDGCLELRIRKVSDRAEDGPT